MDPASTRALLLKVRALTDDEAGKNQISAEDLDELKRIDLLVRVSGEGDLNEMPDKGLLQIIENLLTEDDLLLLECAFKKLGHSLR